MLGIACVTGQSLEAGSRYTIDLFQGEPPVQFLW